jgi:broad specificity phosphatase PhoE
MTEPHRGHDGLGQKAEDLEHRVEEKVEELAHEAEEGESARTPLLVVSGVTVIVAAVVAILLVVAFTAYYLSK